MRTGVALCHHLWRNDVACEETLVMADAQEDRGFERSAEGTRYDKGDGSVNRNGTGTGKGDGEGAGEGAGVLYGDGDGGNSFGGTGTGNGEGDGNSSGERDGWRTETGAGSGYGDGIGYREGRGGDVVIYWISGTPYPFPSEVQEAPCEPE